MLYFVYYNSIQHGLNYFDNKDSLLDPRKEYSKINFEHKRSLTINIT